MLGWAGLGWAASLLSRSAEPDSEGSRYISYYYYVSLAWEKKTHMVVEDVIVVDFANVSALGEGGFPSRRGEETLAVSRGERQLHSCISKLVGLTSVSLLIYIYIYIYRS